MFPVVNELSSFGTENKKFRLVEQNHIKALFAVNYAQDRTTMATLFDTDNIEQSHDVVRDFVTDIIVSM